MSLTKLKENLEKDPRFFYILGALKGDGHLSNNKNGNGYIIKLNVIDKDFIEYYIQLWKEIADIDIPIRKVEIGELKGKNLKPQYVAKFDCKIFFDRDYHNLLPQTIDEKRYYIAGLFDAEGTVGIYPRKHFKKWFRICQKDVSRLNLWGQYLFDIGINSFVQEMKGTHSYLSITNYEDVKAFYDKIPIVIARKKLAMKQVVEEQFKVYHKNLETEKLVAQQVRLYRETNFGPKIIARLMNLPWQSVFSNIVRYKEKGKNKNIKKVSYDDFLKAEEILGRKIPDDIKIDYRKMISYPINDLNSVKVKSIKLIKKEKCTDLNTPIYNNFVLSNMLLSHNSKVRVGKSTLAQQVAYFLAWLIAGGSMAKEEATGKWFVSHKPDKPVRFTVEDNVVFTPEDLQIKARELFAKYGKHQVIVYDEGRAGLDSAQAMSIINKAMQDFFQECGQYGHVILIVLPNFFKLHEDYAIYRSIFLVDVYLNKRMERGFLS